MRFSSIHPAHPERSDDEVGAKSKGVAKGHAHDISAADCSEPHPSTSVAALPTLRVSGVDARRFSGPLLVLIAPLSGR